MEIEISSGVCSKQGIRLKMEDFYLIQNEFNVENSRCTSGKHSLYAVFDGHNGDECAKYCCEQIPHILRHHMQISLDIRDAFELSLQQLDNEILNHTTKTKMRHSGSCLNLVLIDLKTYDMWCINVGDSRCILLRNNFSVVTQLSTDHKPNHPTEHQRIINSWLTANLKGWVSGGRICGILGVSRALGDFDSKEYDPNLLICKPDIIHHKINTQGICEYLVIACDGLYDVMNNERIMNYCQHIQKSMLSSSKSSKFTVTNVTPSISTTHNNNNQQLTQKEKEYNHTHKKSMNICTQFAEQLVDKALGRRSKDNVSVIVVRISPMLIPMTPLSAEQQITPGEDIQSNEPLIINNNTISADHSISSIHVPINITTEEGKIADEHIIEGQEQQSIQQPMNNNIVIYSPTNSMTHSMTQSITMSYDESLGSDISTNSYTGIVCDTDDEQVCNSWKITKIRNSSRSNIVCQKKGRFSVYSEEFWIPPTKVLLVNNNNNNNSEQYEIGSDIGQCANVTDI